MLSADQDIKFDKGADVRRQNYCVLLLPLFLVLFLIGACTKREGIWRGTIEYEGDVQVFNNPADPIYGELALDLEEDLIIGSEEAGDEQFYNVTDLALDSLDNLYVLDAGNGRLQKFGPEGNFLQTIGRKGQGPGEFSTPNRMFVDEKDRVYVSEGRRLQVFDATGEFVKSYPLDHNVSDFCVDGEGNVIASGTLRDEEGSKNIVSKLDSGGKMVKAIDEFVDVQPFQKDQGGATFIFKAYHQYNNMLSLFALDSGSFVYAYPLDYRIMRSDSEGRVSLVIKKNEPSIPISRQEKDQIIDGIELAFVRRGRTLPRDDVERACQFPPHRPFFNGLFVDDEGRIYVRRVGSVLDENRQSEFDIFSSEGHYIYKVALPFSPQLVHSGFLYLLSVPEDTGEVRIKRYRINNWNQIKKGL
jgi:hypothetical protein